MKILFAIDRLGSGGKERRLTELLKMLKLNDDIHFELVVMDQHIHYTEVFDLGIKIHYVIRKVKKDFFVFREFYKICKTYKPDIVHCWDSMTAIYVIPSCKLLNIKLVNGMIVDSPAWQNIFNKHIFRAKISFRFSDLILGNSNAGIKAYDAPEQKSFVIYNGFDFKRTEGIDTNDLIRKEFNIQTKYIIGMVATNSEYKDYLTYFNAAVLILKKRKDITFLAVGRNTDNNASVNLVDAEFRNYFRFVGTRSDVEMIDNVLDVCVLSTFTEGISNSILEYMALGKPVVATSGGGTNEIIIDNVTGFLVSPSNPVEMAAKIELLLNDEKLRHTMGIAGKERVKIEFSIDAMVSKYLSCLKIIYKV